MLLVADPKLPSVTTLVAGEPVRGSWWGHAKGREIYGTLVALRERDDVVVVKLVGGKDTLVLRRLWPALVAIGRSGEEWQKRGLATAALTLLRHAERAGEVRVDELAGAMGLGEKALGDLARDLERRLLALGSNVHTDAGRHVKTVLSWAEWERRAGGALAPCTPDAARAEFEAIASRWETQHGARVRLPWPRL